MLELTAVQQQAIAADETSFLLGAAGAGKTTALQQRLLHLLTEGETAYAILVIVSELPHRQQWLDVIHQSGLGPYADLKITTYNRLAQEMVELFWPLVARPMGFEAPHRPPTILTYDMAQLLMWRTITPMLAEGAFADLRLRPQQIVSQLLDTLNRAALNGISLAEAIERQKLSLTGEPERMRYLDEAAKAAWAFRRFCFQNSLLDLSLVVETFNTKLVNDDKFQGYFSERFRHLLVDNLEEQTPAGQHFVVTLMPHTETTAVAYDEDGGYKRFLAADPKEARKFQKHCKYPLHFEHNFISPPGMTHVANVVENYLLHTKKPTGEAGAYILDVVNGRYRREMVIQLAQQLAQHAANGTPPNQIAIITPYLDGALRYMLSHALNDVGLPYYFLRRRSTPREEPRIRAWLTWLALAHPDWDRKPEPFDVAEALTLSINGLDPVRASFLVSQLYDTQSGTLQPASNLSQTMHDRIGETFVQLTESVRLWLEANHGRLPIDHFLHQLFNNLLAQPQYQPEPDLAGAAVCDWLVETAVRLRHTADALGLHTTKEIGATFIDGINQGLVTANPPELGDPPDPNGIMISTIYGYLLAGTPVSIQVWLETAAQGWWDIPRQPLSNAFVLAKSWSASKKWTMEDDFLIKQQLLSRLIGGLCHRCKQGIILANSELDRRGLRQDGPLWRALRSTIIDSAMTYHMD